MSHDDPEEARSETGEEGWAAYRAATQGQAPHPLVKQAIDGLRRGGHALELGFGAGTEVTYLLDQGFRVTAVDADAGAVRELAGKAQPALRIVRSTFDTFDFEPDEYDIVSALNALPFNPPVTFAAMLDRLLRSIRPGGRFAGILWGERDGWNTPDAEETFHRREDAVRLFEGFELLSFEEYEEEVELACDGTKHGHWYEIIASRPD